MMDELRSNISHSNTFLMVIFRQVSLSQLQHLSFIILSVRYLRNLCKWNSFRCSSAQSHTHLFVCLKVCAYLYCRRINRFLLPPTSLTLTFSLPSPLSIPPSLSPSLSLHRPPLTLSCHWLHNIFQPTTCEQLMFSDSNSVYILPHIYCTL